MCEIHGVIQASEKIGHLQKEKNRPSAAALGFKFLVQELFSAWKVQVCCPLEHIV
jgi:hypothetical protein